MTTKTITKTFSIDNKLYERFELICETKRMNKSKVIQDAIRKFISENFDIDTNTYYRLKLNVDSELVKIEKKEDDFILLSNGNKLNIFDFEMLYESQDPSVDKVLYDLIGQRSILSNAKAINNDDDIVDPSILENHIMSKEHAEFIKKTFMNVDMSKVKDDKETVVREVEPNESAINFDKSTIEDKIEQLKEKYSITEKIDIVKRIKEKRTELTEFSNKELKQFDLNKLENILSYVYDTDVKINESFIGDKTSYIINIPLKYVDINFKNLMNNITGFEYTTNDIKIKPISEKVKEVIENLGQQNFSSIYVKPTHIAEQLVNIIRKVSPYISDDKYIVDVSYDEPLYKITIPEKIACKEIIDFIVNSYSIKRDYIILKTNN